MIFIKSNLYKILFFLSAWSILSFFYDPIILPSPLEVLESIILIVSKGDFIQTIGVTLIKLIIGLILALILGIGVGLAIALNKNLKSLLYPLILFLQSAPIISFILLALIWFNPPIIPVFVLCINSFPNLAINVYEGIENIDKKLLEMTNFYKVDNFKLIRKLYIPSIISHILASIRIILANSFKIIVMAEVVSRNNHGIGSKINWAWINIETGQILAWTIIIVLLSFTVEKWSIIFIKRWMGRYYG